MANQFTQPSDAEIGKGRSKADRWFVLVVYTILVLWLVPSIVQWYGELFFSTEPLPEPETSDIKTSLAGWVFWFAGLGLAASILVYTIGKWFIIRNPTIGMLVTQDTLATLYGAQNPNVFYGPGTHISFPWERRLGENNISLEEASNGFDFTIQCMDGIIKGRGSFRLRPDQYNPVTFLGSVSGVADDITDLIIGEIAEQFKDETVRDALNLYKDLNDHLDNEFRVKDHPIEMRCGIKISDVTIRELLPSEDMQKTMSAIGEAEAIARGTEIILGMTKDEIKTEIAAGRMTQADVNLARDRFLSISGNLEGMQINRTEVDLSLHGIDDDAIKAIAEILKTPGGQAAAAGFASRRGRTNKPKGKTS